MRLSLDSSNIQHEKLILALVKPYIEGFSVKSVTKSIHNDNSGHTDDFYKDNGNDVIDNKDDNDNKDDKENSTIIISSKIKKRKSIDDITKQLRKKKK